ncbi:hypothetical protein J437_LFUL016254 [Ladona fulva]|uniref:ATP-dependent DNA helicase n=1 Tax=Ladona fulva TaxID=123851 RepID=A0A8K0P8V4_LADFU|nr:hypothetical protein J437_LFUL016254 [Ladona fulva]
MLNQNQKEIYDYVCGVIVNQKIENNLLFIDGPSGTGKTLLLNVITGTFRKEEHIVLCTASTGIATLNYKGGVTAHSMFRLPLDSSSPDTYCDIKANRAFNVKFGKSSSPNAIPLQKASECMASNNIENFKPGMKDWCALGAQLEKF